MLQMPCEVCYGTVQSKTWCSGRYTRSNAALDEDRSQAVWVDKCRSSVSRVPIGLMCFSRFYNCSAIGVKPLVNDEFIDAMYSCGDDFSDVDLELLLRYLLFCNIKSGRIFVRKGLLYCVNCTQRFEDLCLLSPTGFKNHYFCDNCYAEFQCPE